MKIIAGPGAIKSAPINRSDAKPNDFRAPNRLKIIIDECNAKIRSNQRDELAYLEKGDAYIHLGDPEEALRNYKRAIEINKQCIKAYYGMASAHAILGENKNALVEIVKAIELEDKQSGVVRGKHDM